MENVKKFKYSIAYVVSIVLVNIGFVYVAPVPLLGEMFPPMSLLVGVILFSEILPSMKLVTKCWGQWL